MNFSNFKNLIEKNFFEFLSLQLSENQIQKFYNFMNLLIEKNKVMNLTSIVDPEEIIIRHFVDSCFLYKFFPDIDIQSKLLDVGTGAGFPGIPLSIIFDKNSFTLSDTLGKRINFLSEVKNELKLNNIELIKGRAEDLAHNIDYRDSFDFVLSRGVAKLRVLAEYSIPFLKIEGKMIAYKMDEINEEIEDSLYAFKVLGGTEIDKMSYILYKKEPKRCIFTIKKGNKSPLKYPRKAGIPSKEPL